MSIPIRVAIIDDLDLVRRGLALVMRTMDDIVLVGATRAGPEAVDLCKTLHPDVVLLDIHGPLTDSSDISRAIRQVSPTTRILAMSTDSDVSPARWSDCGVMATITKISPVGEIIDAIRRVARRTTGLLH